MSYATAPIEQEIPTQPLPVSLMVKHGENTVTRSHKATGHSAATAWFNIYGAKPFSLKTETPEAKNKRISSHTSYKRPFVSRINIGVNNHTQHQLLLV